MGLPAQLAHAALSLTYLRLARGLLQTLCLAPPELVVGPDNVEPRAVPRPGQRADVPQHLGRMAACRRA